jgi:nucleotide-binding universal stress UspA family protein
MRTRVLRQLISLEVRNLRIEPHLARRLPVSLARRYHAIPVAEENGKITVVMADPDDLRAQKAVISSLGLDACMVRGDGVDIDALIEEIWSGNSQTPPPLELLVYPPPPRKAREYSSSGIEAGEVCAYARVLGKLMNARVTEFPAGVQPNPQVLVNEARCLDPDLVICGMRERGLFKRLPTSLLVVPSSRLPIKRILLLVKGQAGEEIALDWALRLARPSGARVTVLVILPPVPLMYSGLGSMQYKLSELLATETPLGKRLRQVAQKLLEGEIDSTLRLRTGTFEMQIQSELWSTSYNLVVLPADSSQPIRSWWFDGLVEPLLRTTDRPILIAKSKSF